MYGIVAWSSRPAARLLDELFSILTRNVEFGLEEFSSTDLISPTKEYFAGCFFAKTYTVFAAIVSCAISTFSDPLMMK